VRALGATALQLGYVTSLGGVATILLSIPIGLLADKQGIKRMTLVAIILFAASYSVFGLAKDWQLTALAYITSSVAMLISNNVCPMVCGACLKSSERTTGMQLCDTVAAIPRLFAPIIAALAIAMLGGLTTEGIRPLFWLSVVVVLIAFLVIYKWFNNPNIPKATEARSFTYGIRRIFSEGVNVKRWGVYYALMMLPWYMGFYIPLYAKEVKGADTLILGLMDSGYWLAVVLLAIPVGLAADRLGRKRTIAALTPLYCLGLILLGYAPGRLILIIAGALNGFTMLAGVTESSMTVELVPRDLLGSWLGLLGFIMGLISFIAPILGGFLWNINPTTLLYFLAVTQILKLGILATMPSKPKYS
jgi:MFS family permease